MDVLARWQGPFILGVIFSLFLPQIPPLFLLISGFSISLSLIYWRFYAISGFLCGMCWFFIHAQLVTSWQLPEHLIKEPIEIIGYVSQIPAHQVSSHKNDILNSKFILTAEQIAGISLPWWQNVNIKLSWRQNINKAQIQLKQGQLIELKAVLKPPHGFANMGGASYSMWLLVNNIRATGYVYNKLPVNLIENDISVRQGIFDKLKRATKDLEYKGILLALTMGEKQAIDKHHWQAIRATGIGHLLAISGLHIGMMFMFGRFIALWLVNLVNLTVRTRLNAPILSTVFGLVSALTYAYLAGFGVTTIRAMLMLSIAMIAIFFARGRSAKNVVICALSAILLLDPLAILSAGVWLSFAAVISILSLFWLWPDSKSPMITGYVVAIIKIQLVLFVCLLPLTALIFNGVSLSGSWVNLIAVPWVSFTTVPLALLATLLEQLNLSAFWLWLLADKSLYLLFAFIELPLNMAGWANTAFMPWHVWLGLLVFNVLLVLPVANAHKLAGVSLLLVAVSYRLIGHLSSQDGWRVDVLDVGQGLAVAIEHQNHWLLYDLGPIYPSGFNTAEQVIAPYLAYYGVNELDWLVISHADSDHAGAYEYFLSRFKVNQLIAPAELNLKSKRTEGAKSAKLCTPQSYNWQGLLIEIYWPKSANIENLSRNDSSCVMRISNKFGAVLLTGDISKRAEKRLVLANNKGEIDLSADIILAPHHGSMSSSSEVFIQKVGAKYVAFSSGFLNRYRFPRSEVVSRYLNDGATAHVTSTSGQISYIIGEQGIKVEQIRQTKLKAWYLNH